MVEYEWDIETWCDDEITDHSHRDKLSEFDRASLGFAIADGRAKRLVLVRDDDIGRSWAYVLNGRLPDNLLDANGELGARVPRQFVAELTRALGAT